MIDESAPAPEYVAARRALLDILEVLDEQRAGLILVGAQAIYLHAPADQTRQPTFTTDGDLAIAPDLLSEHPDIGQVLVDAGYLPHTSPGTFYAPNGIAIDLMVPAGSLPPSTRRTAPLPGQGSATARRTAGLELALLDYSPMSINALDPEDHRTTVLNVAGPAALLIAKLVKLAERTAGARKDRVLAKDAADLLRLLRYCDAEAIGSRLATLETQAIAAGPIASALAFLRGDLDAPRTSLGELAAADLDGIEPATQVVAALRALGRRLLSAHDSAPAPT